MAETNASELPSLHPVHSVLFLVYVNLHPIIQNLMILLLASDFSTSLSLSLSLSRKELDMVLLATITIGIHLGGKTRKSITYSETEHKVSRTDYAQHGHHICCEFFKFIHDFGQDKLTALVKH